MPASSDQTILTEPDRAGPDDPPAPPRPRWWVELGLVLAFYLVYSAVRNRFGSALGEAARLDALRNAERVIDVERALGLFHEEAVQALFEGWGLFLWFWNVFYGLFHFAVTIGVMVWLFRRHPRRYLRWRSTLAATTGLALVGFALFPLMPPRLLTDCGRYGACLTRYDFVDTLVVHGGLWSFDSGTMQSISNQYAAMPSLHIAWATWCTLALWPVVQRRGRVLAALYPLGTLFAIVVTANHYWIDAVGGLVVLALGMAAGRPLTRVLPGLPPGPAPTAN